MRITTPIDVHIDAIDGIALLHDIHQHVTTHIGDFPTIYPDIKLMHSNFDPITGTFWFPNATLIPHDRIGRYRSEATLLHSRIVESFGSELTDKIVDVRVMYGRDGRKEIQFPKDSTDGVLFFRVLQCRFFKSNDETITKVEESIDDIGKLFCTGFPVTLSYTEAASKLRAWSEAGNHGPLDT